MGDTEVVGNQEVFFCTYWMVWGASLLAVGYLLVGRGY